MSCTGSDGIAYLCDDVMCTLGDLGQNLGICVRRVVSWDNLSVECPVIRATGAHPTIDVRIVVDMRAIFVLSENIF